ncbi:MAG TPA: SpoIIE family protein phosphatase [Acidimicrobiales bacterium]|nr:SpoIIE family protein phosphatase [Acidimicrobiales bacterium]
MSAPRPVSAPEAIAGLEDLFEALPALVAYLEGPDHVFRFANQRYLETVGGRPTLGRSVIESIPEAEGQGFVALLDEVRETGRPYVGREVRVALERGPSGGPEERFVDFTYQPVPGPSGDVVGILVHAVDVTEAVQAREALQQAADEIRALEIEAQEDRFRQAIDNMLESVMMCSPVRDARGRVVDLHIDYVNRAVEEIGGRPPEELKGRLMSGAWPMLAESTLFEQYLRIADTGEPLVLEHLEYEDVIEGTRLWGVFDIRASRIADRLFLVWRDVTERAVRERELLEHQEALAEAQRIAHVGSWRWDADDDTVTWSEEFYRICGFGPEVGPERTRFLSLLSPEGVELVQAAFDEAASTGTAFQIEQTITRPDGEQRTVVITGEANKGRDGSITSTRGTVQDVTDQRLVERALHRSEQRLQEEHETVKILQAAIIPKELPELPGTALSAHYLAASENVGVGGDWYDVFPLDGGLVLLTVGDVAGKGVQAAEAVGQLRNSMRMCAVVDPRPMAVIAAMHRLVALGFSAPFATAVVAIYEPATGRLEWASAGHPPLIHRRASGEAALPGPLPTHPPLGVSDLQLHEPYSVTLAAGDSVVLFTDGLVERRDEPLSQGLDRLVATVGGEATTADAISQALLDANLDPAGRQDDVCLFVLSRE